MTTVKYLFAKKFGRVGVVVSDVSKIAEALSTHERIVLEELSKVSKASTKELSEKTGLELVAVERALLYLENKGLVRRLVESRKKLVFTEKGRRYLEVPLPEDTLAEKLSRGPLPVKDLNDEEKIGLGVLRKLGVVTVENGTVRLVKSWKPRTEKFRKLELTEKEVEEFRRRGLITWVEEKDVLAEITELGRKVAKMKLENLVDALTPELLKSGKWKTVKIRRFDVVSPLPVRYPGRRHPLKSLIRYVREILLSMGFKEMRGPWVELAFWNFDAMFQPQDHPARELHDTIYVSNIGGVEPPQELLERVKHIHQEKWHVWDDDVPKKVIMRTHTTAVTFRKFFEGIEIPCKYFSIDRVFRNETIDWKHLSEFHQIEGFIAAEGLSVRDLMGFFVEFYRHFGIKKLKFKPVYNPYTEPSMEIFGWHPEKKTWVEIGNSGIFRPEALEPYGIEVPVIAWGLALERLAMLVYDIEDIRRILGPMVPISWIRERGVSPWLQQS